MASDSENASPYLLVLIAVSVLGPMQFGYHLVELNAPKEVMTCGQSMSAVARLDGMPPRSLHESATASVAGLMAMQDCIPMTTATLAIVNSIYTMGALAGALAAGPFSSVKGRLLPMRATALFFMLGSLLSTVASAVPVLTLGRVLNGVGAGAASVVVPIYIGEIAPRDKRGLFGCFTQISIGAGILSAQVLGYIFSHDGLWRCILGVGVITAVAQGLGLLMVPESPAWVAAVQGDLLAARRILQRLRGRAADIEAEIREAATTDVSHPHEQEALLANGHSAEDAERARERLLCMAATSLNNVSGVGQHVGFADVLKDPSYRPAIIAVVGLMFAQQLCGINSILVYSVSLLANLLPISSAIVTILLGVVNLFATVAFSSLPDRLGRKTCLFVSVVGQGLSSLALALSIIFQVKMLSAVSALFFVGFFAVGLGPVPFIMASELVGQEAVGATQSWGLAGSYVSTFLVVQFFPMVNDALNRKLGGAGWVFLIFAGIAGLFVVFVQLCVPETKGTRNIDEVWGRMRHID